MIRGLPRLRIHRRADAAFILREAGTALEKSCRPPIGRQMAGRLGGFAAECGKVPGRYQVQAWDHLAVPETSFQPRRRDRSLEPSPATATAGQQTDTGAGAGTVVGPLLTTDWAQGAPHWNYALAGSTCAHTLSGCVAIAAVQVMKDASALHGRCAPGPGPRARSRVLDDRRVRRAGHRGPDDEPADVQITYLRPEGRLPIVKTYTVAALSRRTIWVNGEDPGLSATDVSGVVTSLDAALPIIVERALYLNAQGQFFSAGHDAVGVTAASTDWFLAEGATGPFFDMYVLIANPNSSAALADGEQGGPRNVQTYILVANTSPSAGRVRVTLMLEDGTSVAREVDVAANSRTTVWTGGTTEAASSPFGGLTAGKRFGALVESLDVNGQAASIVVERSLYWDCGGVWWAAGSNSLATKVR